jgi:hypothetical protein
LSFAHGLSQFRNIHIAELNKPIDEHKNVGAFKIAMQNSQLMKRLKPASYLHKYAPELLFGELGVVLGVLGDFSVQIALVCELHYNAEIIKDYY